MFVIIVHCAHIIGTYIPDTSRNFIRKPQSGYAYYNINYDALISMNYIRLWMGLGSSFCSSWYMAEHKVSDILFTVVHAGIYSMYSIVSYDRVLVTTIVPKPFYCNNRNVKDSYMIEVLVCVDTKKAGGNYCNL